MPFKWYILVLFRQKWGRAECGVGGRGIASVPPSSHGSGALGGHILFEREPKKYSTSPDNCRHIAKKDLSSVGGVDSLLEFYFEKQ